MTARYVRTRYDVDAYAGDRPVASLLSNGTAAQRDTAITRLEERVADGFTWATAVKVRTHDLTKALGDSTPGAVHTIKIGSAS